MARLIQSSIYAFILTLPLSSLTFAESAPVYKDPNAPLQQRVQDLLSRMTLEEKVAQMRSMWMNKSTILDSNARFVPAKAAKAIPDGIGQMARPSDRGGSPLFPDDAFRSVEETVDFVNDVQHFLVEKTRLGIPALFHEETAHGYLAGDTTIFPIPPALASTWDTDLIEQVYTTIAREVRVRGATVALSPVVDLMREPRYGRAEEFYSEDPYLTSQMGIASVRGQQGRWRPLAKDRIFVTLKHFVHGAPQGGLNLSPADMSERTLRENYLVPFAEIIRMANPAVIMPSYNEIQGVPSHMNRELLQGIGRERLGFKGAYFSDYVGISNLNVQHHVAANDSEAAILAMNAGVDADLPEGQAYANLPALVRAGRISQSQVDAAVTRILAMKFEAGLFENPYADAKRAVNETNSPENIKLANTTAQKSLILLKNDGILPLDPQAKLKLAVIGPNAERALFGGYSGINPKAVGILSGIKAAAGPNIVVSHADGVWITQPLQRNPELQREAVKLIPKEENQARIDAAVKVANDADVILLVLGDNPLLTREAVADSLPGDRNSLELFGDQNVLVEALLATGKPVVALLLNGRPLAVSRLAEKANALFEGWYLGQEGGNAFADILFGKANPGGKLTVSIPRSVGDLPVYYNRHPSADVNFYVEGRRRPLYPFGYGLSYTKFEVSAPRLSKQTIGTSESVGVDVDVTNTGKRAGDEVVQLYIRDDISSVPRPVLELKGFKRVSLNPGEKRTVHFDLGPDALAFWNVNMQWLVEPGTFTISAGNSSDALKPTRLTVVGTP